MKRHVTKAGAPWEPGLATVAMRKHLAELRGAAVALIQEQAAKEPSLERVAQLEALARQVAEVSPHQLRHGLAYRCGSRRHRRTFSGFWGIVASRRR